MCVTPWKDSNERRKLTSLHGEGLVNTVTYTTHLSQPRRPYLNKHRREKHIHREKHRHTERDTEKETQTHRERNTDTDTQRERKRERERD